MTVDNFSVLHTSSTANDRVQKSSTTTPGQNNNSSAANPRSCVTCRKRKVKCDKRNPCSNCVRAKIECVFPSPGRAPRKTRKPPDGELMERLRRLEGVVQTLNAQVEEEQQTTDTNDDATQPQTGGVADKCPFGSDKASVAVDNSVEGLESRFGRLVVDQGRSRYINNSFWASLNNEVEDLKAILIEPSDDEDENASSPVDSGYSSQHQSFMFGYRSSSVDMLALHPSNEQAHKYWAIYKENVDPLVKVLHVPTIEPMVLDAAAHPGKISKGLECLMFAIYYGAVTSVMPQECLETFGEDRSTLLERYRFAQEQALVRANFLYCEEMIILQAFVIFLTLLRRNDDARKIWTLTGLVVRISQTLGIHRDGTHFGLEPFEIEMRRRLWWQVCILDARASEDHGCDPTIVEASFDTRMPLNVNDSDLDPNMEKMPEDRLGFTDITFCIIRYEVANLFRRILYVPPSPNRCHNFFSNLTIPEKEKWLSECHQKIEDKYLKHCDMSVPLYWVTATISRLVMSKMWLVVYHPHQRKDGGASLPQETKDKLFITSLENIEYSILLETEARIMKWTWLFRTYVQWHAIAFLLSELCVRTKGEAVERAWRALEATAGRWWFPLGNNFQRKGRQGCLWKPLRKLMDKARAARERELALERASAALKGNLTYQNLPEFLNQDYGSTAFPDPPQQQYHEKLDAMLQPAAPKLGEVPHAQKPSFPATFDRDFLGVQSPVSSGNNTSPNNNTSPQNNDEGQNFASLLNMGLDYVMHDIVGNEPIGPPPGPLPPGFPGELTDSFPNNGFEPNSMNGNANSSSTTSNAAAKASPSDDSATMGIDSPVLPDGSVDWANWDDLVQQYGMDVDAQQATRSNGAGFMGMSNWY